MDEGVAQQPVNQEVIRNPDGTFPKGVSGNPAGRPPGKTLKEYQAEKFRLMSDEDKEEFLKDIAKDIRWKMSEGNPYTQNDITTLGKELPAPILGGISNALQSDHSTQEDTGTQEAS